MKNELLAPNGKPSKLNTMQYELVRTTAFKNWFGDWEKDPANASKVLDDNGEPLVVYHGTNSDFTEFSLEKVGSNVDYGMWGSGFYFSPLRSFSKYYGSKILKLFLNIRNPFVRNPNVQGSKSQFKSVYGKEASLNLRNEILSYNYDGVIQYESGQKNLLTQIIAFEPNQIKLADGKNTTFDSGNNNIRFVKGGRTIAQTPAPNKDRVYGSDVNKNSSSKNLSSAKLIKFDDKTLEAIKNKVKEHNEEHPDKKINLSSAKAVVRRGMGAYSSSHRPTISGGKPNSRVAWGLARLNAFTYKIVNYKSKSGKYTQDDDLIEELGFKVADYKNGGEMKDIRCINCGWEWNKKDSELWDMYVCHKCGFDNTTFYTSIPVNSYSKGGKVESKNPDYLKMFLDL
jgi:hypothetical protein